MNRQDVLRLAVAVALLAGAAARGGESLTAVSALNEGNAALAAGKYDAALAAYKRAGVEAPDAAEVSYNQGIAHYRLDHLDDARKAFGDALRTRDPALEAKAKYNLGNCAYRTALQRLTDLPGAIEELQRAIDYWRDALELTPGDRATRENIETAQLLMKDLIDKEKKRQEEEKKKQEEEQKKNPQSQPSSQPQEQPEQQDQQKNEQKKKEQPKPGEQEEKNSQKQPDQKNKDDSKGKQPQKKESKGGPGKKSEPSMEEAQRKLQAIRDKERARRDDRRRREAMMAGREAVERDW
ncbi:MAG: tetratricopeptide repeat protein [Phycisphaerae bacterium]